MNSLEWLQFMLSYALQVSLVIGVAWGLDRWTMPSRSKARIWTVCYVSILVLLFIGVVLPRMQWLHPWSTLQPKQLLLVATTEDALGRILLAIWVLGVGVVLTRWIVHFFMLQHILRSCPRVPAEDYHMICRLLSTRHINRRKVEYLVCPEEFGPFCYQFHRPIVCLPASLVAGDADALKHVVRHELAHLETQHPLQLFFQKFVQAVLWFHPLVWISAHRAALVREFVCDDASTGEDGSTASYLRALVKVIEARTAHKTNTLSIVRSRRELTARTRRLVAGVNQTPLGTGLRPVTALLLVAGLCTQLWLPTNPLASTHARWSPWPTWSAATLHAFNISARDYERFDRDNQFHEWLEESGGSDD